MRKHWLALAAAVVGALVAVLVVMMVPSVRSPPPEPDLRRSGCGLLGGCDMDLPQLPSCNCYLNADCVGGGIGFRVCQTQPGTCRVWRTSNNKLQDGSCTFFWWAGLDAPAGREAFAAAADGVLGAYADIAVAGGAPAAATIEAALATVPVAAHPAVELVAMNSLILIIGRIQYDDLNPHARGHFHYPQATAIDYRRSTHTLGYAQIEPLDTAVQRVLATSRRALVEYIRRPDRENFMRTMLGLRAAKSSYSGFGRCEFPHPPEHRHPFVYEDAADCIAGELLTMLEPLSGAAQRDRR